MLSAVHALAPRLRFEANLFLPKPLSPNSKPNSRSYVNSGLVLCLWRKGVGKGLIVPLKDDWHSLPAVTKCQTSSSIKFAGAIA